MDNIMDCSMTHPWISFHAPELEDMPVSLLINLGEAKSKCEHLAGVPLKPSLAEEMHKIYLVRGALSSSAIEGNTLSEKEAQDSFDKKSKLPKSQKYLEKEVENILTASNEIMDELEAKGRQKITEQDIKKYNKAILKNLEFDEDVVAGDFRKHPIVVGTYVGPKWEEIKGLVDDLCVWLNGAAFTSISEDPFIQSIIKAVFAHVYVAWIHPFGDGNGRLARLLEFRFLLEGGVPSIAAHLLSNHYNKTRTEYYRQLDKASKNGGTLLSFLEYSIAGLVDQLRLQILYVKRQQWTIAWYDFVHEVLNAEGGLTGKRQIDLVLGLTEKFGKYSKQEILNLTPKIALAYAGKTTKTLTRDINKLLKLKLVCFEEGKYYANSGLILSFLPRTKKGERIKQLEAMHDIYESDK